MKLDESYEDWDPQNSNERTIRDSEHDNINFDSDEVGGNGDEVDPQQQLGSLGFMMGSVIAGTTSPDKALDMVMGSKILSNSVKELIQRVVSDERGRLERGRSQYNFKDVGGEDEGLQETKKKIKINFQRFL